MKEMLSLDLGFGHAAPEYQDIKVMDDKPDPVDSVPSHLVGDGFIH